MLMLAELCLAPAISWTSQEKIAGNTNAENRYWIPAVLGLTTQLGLKTTMPVEMSCFEANLPLGTSATSWDLVPECEVLFFT